MSGCEKAEEFKEQLGADLEQALEALGIENITNAADVSSWWDFADTSDAETLDESAAGADAGTLDESAAGADAGTLDESAAGAGAGSLENFKDTENSGDIDYIQKNDAAVINEGNFDESDIDALPVISSEDRAHYQNKTSGCYFYERLNNSEKDIYGEMLCILDRHLGEVKLGTTDMDLADRAYEALWRDHPDLFYVEGCSYMSYYMNDQMKALTFTGLYTMDDEEISSHHLQIERYTGDFISNYMAQYPNGSDDYGIVKCWYDYLINNTEYDLNSPNNQNILSVMENGKSVCQGYARATQYVLSKMGIDTLLVIGSGRDGEVHAWNEVYADGNWYHLDATWGDASYEIQDASMAQSVPPVNYDYLLVTDEEIQKTHVINNKDELPRATATADNYYVREGLYFTEVNEGQLQAAFQTAKAGGAGYVTLKMDNADTYEKMSNYLLKEQKIFDYLDGSSTVSYAENREQNYMVFWLNI